MDMALQDFLADRQSFLSQFSEISEQHRTLIMHLIENAWMRGALWQWKK